MVLLKMKKTPWEQYAVGDLADWQEWTPECKPLRVIWHVTHINDGLRIFEDREIRPSRITSASVLRPSCTEVVWLSANDWVEGSPYGTVSFEFDWQKMIDGKRLYWVEDVTTNRHPALRFLITGDRPAIHLARYNPEVRNGPLYYDKKKSEWYWNGKYVVQFLVDETLPLSDCANVTFVEHRKNSCKKGGCDERGESKVKCGAKFLANLISGNLISSKSDKLSRLFLNSEQKEKRLHDHAALAWDYILKSLSKGESGTISSAHPAASALAKAILDRFGSGRRTTDLANLFRNRKELRHSLIESGLKAFGVRSAGALSYLEDEED